MAIGRKGFNNTQVAVALFQGGLNTSVPALSLEPGEALQLQNYEVNNLSRYERVMGYERYDGQPSPFGSLFYGAKLDTVTGVTVGDTLTGDTSGATGVVAAIDNPSSTVCLVNLTGEFTLAGETLNTSAYTLQSLRKDFAESQDAVLAFTHAKEAYYRTQITAVPGSGPVRGVVTYLGTVYAFRDTADGLNKAMFKATPSGWEQVATPEPLLPGGNHRFVEANFTGSAGTHRLVGVDGVNPAFVYDGTTYTPISTGMATEDPVACAVLPSQILVLGYRNGSLMTSKIGDPTDYTAVNGGSEIAVGDEVVELQTQPNKALAIFCRRQLQILYGTTPEDFELTVFSQHLSAVPHSVQSLGDAVFLSDAGIRRLTRVTQFGDFQDEDLSIKVRELIDSYRGRAVASYVVREKNQYRLCFSDGAGLIMTFLGQEAPLGVTMFSFDIRPSCAYSGRDLENREIVLVGAEDGFVYQMETGYSADGDPILAICRTTFAFLRDVESRKRFKKLMLEVDSSTRSDLQVRVEFDYASQEAPTTTRYRPITALSSGGYWDVARWNEVTWSQQGMWLGELFLSGVGRNLSVLIKSESAVEPPHTLNSMMIHWAPRARRH